MASNSRGSINIETMLSKIEREITTLLWETNECFDDSFEQHLLHAVKSRVESTCSKFKMEFRLAQRGGANRATIGGNGNEEKVGNDSNPLRGRSGRSIKIESTGEVIELSDDEDIKLIPKKEVGEALSTQNDHIGNEQMEMIATKQLTSNNRLIPNEGEASAFGLIDDTDSETETEIANDTPSTSSGMGSKSKDSGTNTNKAAAVGNPRQCDEVEENGGAKNVQETAKVERERHKCQICGYIGLHKGNLNRHMRIHTGERPYRCNKCPKSFALSQTLNKHQLIHVKQYKFRCVGCARGFNEESEKVAHDKVCGKHRYECYLCKIDPPHVECMFVTNKISNLKHHMRTHTGEKPFRCEICSKRFKQNRCLKKHLNKVHSRANR